MYNNEIDGIAIVTKSVIGKKVHIVSKIELCVI